MGEAGREIEIAVGLQRSDWAGRDAELAFETRIEIERLAVGLDVLADQHRAEKHETTEFGMDQIAVDAHFAESGRFRDALVRHDPAALGKTLSS